MKRRAAISTDGMGRNLFDAFIFVIIIVYLNDVYSVQHEHDCVIQKFAYLDARFLQGMFVTGILHPITSRR